MKHYCIKIPLMKLEFEVCPNCIIKSSDNKVRNEVRVYGVYGNFSRWFRWIGFCFDCVGGCGSIREFQS